MFGTTEKHDSCLEKEKKVNIVKKGKKGRSSLKGKDSLGSKGRSGCIFYTTRREGMIRGQTERTWRKRELGSGPESLMSKLFLGLVGHSNTEF